MPLARTPRLRLISVLCFLVGAAMAWGGGQEAVVYLFEEPLPVAVGGLGAVMGLLMVLAAIGLWTGHPAARRLGFASAGGTALITVAGILFKMIGILSGAIIGVLGPILVMTALAATGGGAGRVVSREPSSPGGPPDDPSGLRRVVTAG